MRISRRRFLQMAAAGGLGFTVPPWLTGLLENPGQRWSLATALSTVEGAAGNGGQKRRSWCMVIDLKKCEGCVTIDEPPQCTVACIEEHHIPFGKDWIDTYKREGKRPQHHHFQEWIKVEHRNGDNGQEYFAPMACMQCENAPCVNVCPVGATYHNDEGIVLIDHDRCIGCRFCMIACPYDARSFIWGEPEPLPDDADTDYSPEYPLPHRKGTVVKCMFCAHRLREGNLPACAEGCPMFAIYIGDLEDDLATNGQEVVRLSTLLANNSAYRYKEEKGTRPRVFYLPGHGQESGHTLTQQAPAQTEGSGRHV